MEVKLVKFRYISTVFIAIFLSACSASGIKYSEIVQTELNGQSEIIVFRKSQLAASGGCYRINVDGKEIGILANGGYLRKMVEPGKHVVSISLKELDFEIETIENTKSFVEYNIGLNGMSAFPIGVISVVSMDWNVAFVDTPKDYGLKAVSNLRESLKTHTCMSE